MKPVDIQAAVPTEFSVPMRGPLSAAQEQLYLLQMLEPGNLAYNESMVLRIQGPLNMGALSRTIDRLVERHAILRTRFPAADMDVVQVVMRPESAVLEYEDVAGSLTEVLRLAEDVVRRPFLLHEGPMFRCKLWSLSSADHVLLFAAHHIVADGWSMGIICNELSVIYSALVRGQKDVLEPLTVQYIDYVEDERIWLASESYQKRLQDYLNGTAGVSLMLDLPCDRPRPTRQSYRGAEYSIPLRQEIPEAIRSLAVSMRVTPFIVYLTAFHVLLRRHTGQESFLIATPVAGRRSKQWEQLVGLFANLVALRATVAAGDSFREAVARTRAAVLSGLQNARVPFEGLVAALSPSRSLRANPVTQVMFTLENEPLPEIRMLGLKVTCSVLPITSSKLDLHLSIAYGNSPAIRLNYNTDLFDSPIIAKLTEEFAAIVEGAILKPDALACGLGDHAYSREIPELYRWPSIVPDSSEMFAHVMIQRQARKTPDRVAVEHDGKTMTYDDLHKRTTRLAGRLHEMGARPETVIGVLVARSFDIVAAPLAVLISGAAYMPIDPDIPESRIASMVNDCRPLVLLVSEDLKQRVPASFSGAVLILTPFQDEKVFAADHRNLPVVNYCQTENLAYVMYTSGSTGTPKGVLVAHGALANILSSMRVTPGIASEDSFLSVTSLSFDISGLEIFLPLIAGAKVIIAQAKTSADGYRLLQLLKDSAATMMQATPSTWRLLLAADWTSSPGLTALCGGEALDVQLANDLLQRCGRVYNMYGPTETTIWSAIYCLPFPTGNIRIGYPIVNTSLHVLDGDMRPVVPGVIGDLYIGGRGLARGYHHQPALTAAVFVPNPFSEKAGARLYNTGDMAVLSPDGAVRVVGRVDQQVKIRGHRLELGEVEAALNLHDLVASSAVIAHATPADDVQLVAYVVTRPEVRRAAEMDRDQASSEEVINRELKRHLATSLPEYAVPSSFVLMAAMPLSSSGKIDRKALPQPHAHRTIGQSVEPPITRTERKLAEIWLEFLDTQSIGRNADFFELGGHSLLAAKVIRRMREVFDVELYLVDLFQFPTIADLALHIEAQPKQKSNPILRLSRKGEDAPLSYEQQRLWFIEQMSPGDTAYHIAAAFRISGFIDFAFLDRSLVQLAERHEILRSRFVSRTASEAVQIVDDPPKQVLIVSELPGIEKSHRDEHARRIASKYALLPFDLERGPVWRAMAARFDHDDHLLVLAIHHIAADGSSAVLLVSELQELMIAAGSGRSSDLPQLPIQYADYAIWQRSAGQLALFERELKFWRKQLHGAPQTIDFLRKPRTLWEGRSGVLPVAVPGPILCELQMLARREGATLFMMLFAAFAMVLGSAARTDDIVVGTDVAGRNDVVTEGLVGLFVNQLVLRIALGGASDFREVVRRARLVVSQALAHQQLPFDRLVQELNPVRHAARSPLFQVKLVLQEAHPPLLRFPEARVETVPIIGRSAKFDLLIDLVETEGSLKGFLEYKNSFLTETAAEELVEQFQVALTIVAQKPEIHLDELNFALREHSQRIGAEREALAEKAMLESFPLSLRRRGNHDHKGGAA